MSKKIDFYQAFIYVIMFLLLIICLMPFALMVVASFSSEASIVREGYTFIPSGYSLDAYKYLMSGSYNIFKSYAVSIGVTALGTTLGLILTISLAYPLSRAGMPGKNIISFVVFFTMLFNGGLIPTYIMWTTVFSIKNTYAAYILPNLLARAFYIMMMRTYFSTSIPVTVGLLVGIGYWNDWQNGLYYITETEKYSVQVLLNSMLRAAQATSEMSTAELAGTTIPTNGVRMACAVMGILPIVIIYPFTQKYIVKGITIGGVKG